MRHQAAARHRGTSSSPDPYCSTGLPLLVLQCSRRASRQLRLQPAPTVHQVQAVQASQAKHPLPPSLLHPLLSYSCIGKNVRAAGTERPSWINECAHPVPLVSFIFFLHKLWFLDTPTFHPDSRHFTPDRVPGDKTYFVSPTPTLSPVYCLPYSTHCYQITEYTRRLAVSTTSQPPCRHLPPPAGITASQATNIFSLVGSASLFSPRQSLYSHCQTEKAPSHHPRKKRKRPASLYFPCPRRYLISRFPRFSWITST